jgi:hypothetical protein
LAGKPANDPQNDCEKEIPAIHIGRAVRIHPAVAKLVRILNLWQ